MIQVAVKVLLSGTLLILAVLCMWEIYRVWFDRTLVLAPFDYLDAGKPSAESGAQFARMVRVDMVRIARLYGVDEPREPAAAHASGQSPGNVAPQAASNLAVASTDQIGRAESVELPAAFRNDFESVEFKAYGVDLGNLFKSIRRFIETPGEITGSVTVQGGLHTVFAEMKGRDRRTVRWNVMHAPDVTAATHDVACRLFRHLVSEGSQDAPLFRQIEDEDFCLFNRGLAAYELYRTQRITNLAEAKKNLDKAGEIAAGLVTRSVGFPYVDKFAAIVFLEQGKLPEAELANERYLAWLKSSGRTDRRTTEIRDAISDRSPPPQPVMVGPRKRIRPVQPGTTAGILDVVGSGMICCLVDMPDGRRGLLSANHVFGSKIGASIVQPGTSDGGKQNEVVAEVVQVSTTAAVATLLKNVASNPQILGFGPITGIAAIVPSDIGQVVVMYGRDGARREGKILGVNAAIAVSTDDDPRNNVTLTNVIVTSNISSPGDSGAAVLTAEGKLVGMIYAGSQSTTIVVPIESVLAELNASLVL